MKKSEMSMSVFDLCRKKVKMSVRETFTWLSIPESILDYYSLEAEGKYFRLCGDLFMISCEKGDFDRWCNSTDSVIDLSRKSGRRIFIDMIEDMTKRGVELTERK